ncbi:MAG: hypothetical protein GTO45_13630 [Candidatus Aminicenantes bacterium]|nr:hypothetical protein [Candidatus Aminicenantes bacterium]NIM79817.1 hypothetical protein [Candidatus Aminicenantes bacterium]NIN19147.1 hypothetical protein [Candidatus Aminicenantes bacterium]NIN43051.1 hypothetical protein [Candidatus Aminicenantes bacterium]NIN85792.1 hypothetical protein [Candidatus Aminicenantes bacterium]
MQSKKFIEEIETEHAYAFDLDWFLMKDLVLRAEDVKNRAIGEIKSFLEKK